jgi:hypothetical protein
MPLRIVAWRSRGTYDCDIVISDEDAQIILGSRTLLDAMNKCAVSVIISKEGSE